MSEKRALRVASWRGGCRDRRHIAQEMLGGGLIDLLIGVRLAGPTMSIVRTVRREVLGAGYAKTSVAQMRQARGAFCGCVTRAVSNP